MLFLLLVFDCGFYMQKKGVVWTMIRGREETRGNRKNFPKNFGFFQQRNSKKSDLT